MISPRHPLAKLRETDPEYRIVCALKVALLMGEASITKDVLDLGAAITDADTRDRLNTALRMWDELKTHLSDCDDIVNARLKKSLEKISA